MTYAAGKHPNSLKNLRRGRFGVSPFEATVLRALPGTVVDIIRKTGLSERQIRFRVWMLQRSGAVKIVARKTPPRRGGAWCVYEQA